MLQLTPSILTAGCGAGLALRPDSLLHFVANYPHEPQVVHMMTVEPGFGGPDISGARGPESMGGEEAAAGRGGSCGS